MPVEASQFCCDSYQSSSNKGVLGIAVFFNECHDDNTALIPLTRVLTNVTYCGDSKKNRKFRVGIEPSRTIHMMNGDGYQSHKLCPFFAAGSECGVHSLRVSQLISVEKNKEFWLYEGSETVEPFRETVNQSSIK